MIELRHTPRYDPQQASQFRTDPCVRWVHARTRARVPVVRLAREVGLTCSELHRLEDGELQTNDAGWNALHDALKRLTAEAA